MTDKTEPKTIATDADLHEPPRDRGRLGVPCPVVYDGPKTPTLAEVLEGAERAATRVAKWPEWKRELSGSGEDDFTDDSP